MPKLSSFLASWRHALACVCLLFSAGCYTPLPFDGAPPPWMNAGAGGSFWAGDHLTGKPSVRISLSEQRAYLYKGGQLAGVSPISSGREGRDTVTGDFHILQKDRHHVSSLFGDYVTADGSVVQRDIDTSKDPKPPGAIYDGAKMPYFMRIVGGTGMHQGYLPGYPASHGCIRMPGPMAAAFYRTVQVGTPVRIEH